MTEEDVSRVFDKTVNMDELDRFCDLVGPNGEFPVDAVYFHNDLLEPRIYQVGYNDIHALSTILATLMSRFITITLPLDAANCSAVRMFIEEWDTTATTNFAFAAFLAKAGFQQISPRCKSALVIGVNDDMVNFDVFTNIPRQLYRHEIPVIPVGIDGRIDICCDTPLAGRPIEEFRQILREMRGGPEWRLNIKCQFCTRGRRSCDYVLSCDRCKANDFVCSPSDAEWVIRAKRLNAEVSGNLVPHNNLAKYVLHTQATYHGGVMLSAADLGKARRAIMTTELHPGISPDGPFPTDLMALVGSSTYYKLEWMDAGKYIAKFSDRYEGKIMAFDTVTNIATRLKCAPKLVDTCNFAQIEKAYETWVVSLEYPGKIVEYTGYAFWKNVGVLKTRVKMSSVRFGPTGILTVTVLYHENVEEKKKA